MASPETTLIIPVESQVRELDAKLLLACAAAERGFPVVIGSRAFVHYEIAAMPRGVYLAKSMRTLSERMFEILRQLGHEIVAWDEEALVRFRPGGLLPQAPVGQGRRPRFAPLCVGGGRRGDLPEVSRRIRAHRSTSPETPAST